MDVGEEIAQPFCMERFPVALRALGHRTLWLAIRIDCGEPCLASHW